MSIGSRKLRCFSVDKDQTLVAVCEDYVLRCSSVDGLIVKEVGGRGSAPKLFIDPLDVDTCDNVMVCDSGNMRVQVLDKSLDTVVRAIEMDHRPVCARSTKDGDYFVLFSDLNGWTCVALYTDSWELVREFCSHGTGLGQLLRPRTLAVLPSGNVVVGDTTNHRLCVFTPRGDLVSIAAVAAPTRIAVTKDRLFVHSHRSIRVLSVLAGDKLEMIGEVTPHVRDFEMCQDGDALVVCNYRGHLTRMPTENAITFRTCPEDTAGLMVDGPLGMCQTADGNYLFASKHGVEMREPRALARTLVIDGMGTATGVAVTRDNRLAVGEYDKKRVLLVDWTNRVDVATPQCLRIVTPDERVRYAATKEIKMPGHVEAMSLTKDGHYAVCLHIVKADFSASEGKVSVYTEAGEKLYTVVHTRAIGALELPGTCFLVSDALAQGVRIFGCVNLPLCFLQDARGICLLRGGAFAVCDFRRDRLLLFTLYGGYLGSLDGLDSPSRVMQDRAGRLVVSEREAGRVSIVSFDQTMLE